MVWFWIGIALLLTPAAFVVLVLSGLYVFLCFQYLDNLVRIFRERPLFIIPRGEPLAAAEQVDLRTDDGLTLRGSYFRGIGPRRGVILFGLEFGSNRWSCVPYCQQLLDAGFDVFTYEPRNQGESDSLPGYEPLQWVTVHELTDIRAALSHLKARPDADPAGVGFFGISKGANAGLIAASTDPYVRCLVTDGAFGTYSTVVPYMRKWISIYNTTYFAHGVMPGWYYGLVARRGIRRAEREGGVRFLSVEDAVRRLKRPLFMIHGEGDTYIKPAMAREVFDQADGRPKEFWLVPKAKHNQALHVAGAEYHRRVLDFFLTHYARPTAQAGSAS